MTTGQRRPRRGASELESLTERIRGSSSLSQALQASETLYHPDRGLVPLGAQALVGGRDGLNMTQLRRLFGELKAVSEMGDPERARTRLLVSVHPLLAYAFGRQLMSRRAYNFFKTLLDPAKVNSTDDLKALGQFLQALMGYAKFYDRGGGR